MFIVTYLEGSGGVVLSDGVSGGVLVNNIENSGQDSRVRSKISSLHNI
jgi:hypothetical protein